MISDGEQDICYICGTGKSVFYKRFRDFADALMRGGLAVTVVTLKDETHEIEHFEKGY